MREVDFFKLPRPIQDRFLSSIRGEVPAPLLTTTHRSLKPMIWIGVSVVALITEVVLLRAGFGDLQSQIALQPAWMLATHAAVLALGVFCVGWSLLLSRRHFGLPYRPQIYLFQSGVVNASTPAFQVHDATEFVRVGVSGAVVGIVTGTGQQFNFAAKNADEAQAVLEKIEKGQARLREALTTNNRRELALLSPLVDTGFSSPFSSNTPLVPPRAVPYWAAALAAVAVGALLGGSAWRVRNQLSEKSLFQTAARLDKPEAYRAYIARGGHQSQVRELLLPRAELRRVHTQGSLDAMEKYVSSHPNSKITAEVDAVHRDMLLKELNAVRKEGSPSTLASFQSKNKRTSLIAKEIAVARRAMYIAAHKKFLDVAADPGGDVAGFIGKALAFARDNGPVVQLRFRRRMAGSVDEIEKAVIKSRYYLGSKLLPKNYFRDEDARRREQRAAKQILVALQKSFSPEILKFELGPALEQSADLESVKVPTIYVDRRVQLSGLFPNLNPRGIFVGMGVLYEVQLMLPGTSETVKLKHSSWKQPERKGLKVGDRDPDIAAVYEEPMNASLDKFVEWFLSRVLAKP